MSKSNILRTIICLIVSFFTLTAWGQKVTVSGVVIDGSNDDVLIGVTVMEKGTSNGVSTDLDGRFTLSVQPNATLTFSSVGYQSQEVKVAGQKEITVVMKESSTVLDELVVIGYGVQRKSDITGSISSIAGKDINDVPVASALQALQGKASGVNIIQNTGAPGSATTIKIRGTGTVNDSDPLYVVDGFIVDNIDHINPNDIANIEVFKDAASSAVYGARAANGVVAITTKTGQEGKVKVTFDAFFGVSEPWKTIDMMDQEDYLLMQDYINGTSLYSADGQLYMTKQEDGTLAFDQTKKDNLDKIKADTPSSWWDAITQTGVKQQYSASVSGGSQKTKYLVSASYFNERGIVKTSNYQRVNVRANLSQELSSWLNMSMNVSYANEDRDNVPGGSGSILKQALYYNPTTVIHRLDGYWNASHPIAVIERNHNKQTNDRIDLNMSFDAKIGKYLTYQLKGSYYTRPQVNDTFTEVGNLEEKWGISDLTTVYKNSSSTNKWEINNLLTFNWQNDVHAVTVLAGQTAEGYKYSYQQSTKRGTPSNAEDQWYLSSGYTGDKTYGLDRKWTAVGLIGRINYNVLDRYLFQANVRADGSSKFSKDNRWGYFPSVSVGWKFSEESFLNTEWMNLGKLRVGYGILGNNRIDELATYTYLTNQYNYAYGTGQHSLQPGSTALTIGNPDIKWEKTKTFNVGLDFGFLTNSITFGIEYFDKRTSDMLIAIPTVLSAGLNSNPMTNAGAVRNYGIETSLNYQKNFGKFSFSAGFNLSWIKNEVTSLGTGNEPIYGANTALAITDYVTKTVVGQPIGSFYGYVTDGIFDSYEEVQASAQYDAGKLLTEQTTKPGDFRFKDLNGDGQITPEDRTFLGSPLPDFIFGIPLQFSYGDWDLNMFFQGQTGNEIFNVTRYNLYNASTGNVLADLRSKHWSGQLSDERAWYPLNLTDEVPELRSSDTNQNFRASNFFIEDGSYLRLKELRLTYNLPKSLISKWGISNLAFSLTGYNLLTFTAYEGLDPEVGRLEGTEGNNLNMGVDHGNYPQSRSFTFGVKLSL